MTTMITNQTISPNQTIPAIREFLSSLQQQQVKLWAEGDQLRCQAPKGVLTAPLVEQLKVRKAEILQFLGKAGQRSEAPPIQPVSRQQRLPLSFAQERLWVLEQMGIEEAYVMPAALRLRGTLNIAALQQSLSEIVRRHESLRTTFVHQQGTASQVIQPPIPLALPVIDLQHLKGEQQWQAVVEQANAEAHRPFDLASDLMLRATLLCLGCTQPITQQSQQSPPDLGRAGVGSEQLPTDFILLLTMHHIATDGWSIGVLINELTTLYRAFLAGTPSPLPDLAIQYADFAHWQRSWLSGAVLEEHLAYWQKQLSDAPQRSQLPSDHPYPRQATLQGGMESLRLEADVTQALQKLSQRQGTTLFTTLLAAFNLLIARYSDQEDVVVATPIANRNHQAIEPLIGFFVNRLVLRNDLRSNPSFVELLARVHQVTQDAYAHQDLPFEKIVDALQPQRIANRNAFTQIGFALQNAPMHTFDLPGVQVEMLQLQEEHATRNDLEVHLWEAAGALQGRFLYSSDLFASATIRRMIGHFQTLLRAVVANPNQPIATLPLLTHAERQQLLVECNATSSVGSLGSTSSPSEPTEPGEGNCIHHLFEAQVERTPDAIAVVMVEEQPYEIRNAKYENPTHNESLVNRTSKIVNQLTYAELNARANQLARHLQGLGVGPEVLVGLYLERSADLVVALLAILKAGGAYVPLDPAYPTERLTFVLADTQAPVVITHSSLLDSLPAHHAQLVLVDRQPADHLSVEKVPSTVQPRNLAYVIYTSGSTGTPNGVLVQHDGLCNSIKSDIRVFTIEAGARIPHVASFNFDAATSYLFMGLCAGATVYLVDRPAEWIGPKFVQLMQDVAITHAVFPFSILAALPAAPLPALKVAGAGGDICPPEMVARWGQGRRFFNIYGPTEATITTTIAECVADGRKPTIGRPIANLQTYILDRQRQPVPIGVPGELYIGGIGVARGYLNRPELTAQKFVEVVIGDRQETRGNNQQPPTTIRLYKTGDLARWVNGSTGGLPQIEFLGRMDNQVKIRGFRIEPGEINNLLAQHPDVQVSLVTARDNWAGEKYLIAYVVAKEAQAKEKQVDEKQAETQSSLITALRNHLKATLPDYMLPSTFVLLDTMPLTPNGKIDLHALPTPAEQTRTDYLPPRTDIEMQIAAVWSSVLGVTQIGVQDSFFALGGNSIMAIHLVSALEAHFRLKVSVQSLFEFSSIETFAPFLESRLLESEQASKLHADQIATDPLATDPLAAEALLDPTIQPAARMTPLAKITQPSTILLTGATGFLGAHLLDTLLHQSEADIYCLVRAPNEATGLARIQKNLADYGLAPSAFAKRIHPLLGDLGEARLGLSEERFAQLAEEIDVIYHNGALVNFVLPYPQLKAANVLGTQEVLRLACQQHSKPVHFVSTLSVLRTEDRQEGELILETDPLRASMGLKDGYSASKWVAEKLVIEARTRGLPVAIYRPRRITGHSQSGVSSASDLFNRMFTGCLQLGLLPSQGLWGEFLDMTPVDFVSQAIVYLAQRSESLGQVFHLFNPQPIASAALPNLIQSLGYALELTDYETWYAALLAQAQDNPNHPLHDLLAMFTDVAPPARKKLTYGLSNLLAGLADSTIVCPPVDSTLLRTYLAYFERSKCL